MPLTLACIQDLGRQILCQTVLIVALLEAPDADSCRMVLQVDAQEAVRQVLTSVFTQHGAVQTSSLTLGRSGPSAPQDAVVLLSPEGTRLDLRSPHTKFIVVGCAHWSSALDSVLFVYLLVQPEACLSWCFSWEHSVCT